jgi:hypothetical protein
MTRAGGDPSDVETGFSFMTYGDDDADRFRVPRWIRDHVAEPTSDEAAELSPGGVARPPSSGEGAAPAVPPFEAVRGTGAAGAEPWYGDELVAPPMVYRPRAEVQPGREPDGEPGLRRRGLILVGLAAGLIVVIGVVLLLALPDKEQEPVGAPGPPVPPSLAVPTVSPGAEPPPTSAVPSSAPPPPGGSETAPVVPPVPGAEVTFGPVTIEAEARGNTLTGSAFVDRYPGASGGSIVRNLGDWGLREGPGTLRFNGIDVPVDGTYTLTFAHVNIDNERSRTAVIAVDGRDPLLVTVVGSSTCCRLTAVKVELAKGENSIAFSNRSNHAPSIDKITLSLP